MTVRAGGLSDSMRALLEALRRDADQVFGTRRIEIIPGQAQVRESSEVVRAEVRTHTRTVNIFAKVFRPRPGEAGLAATHQRFRRDCDITRRVFQSMQSSPDLRAVELFPGSGIDRLYGLSPRIRHVYDPDDPACAEALCYCSQERCRRVDLAARGYTEVPMLNTVELRCGRKLAGD